MRKCGWTGALLVAVGLLGACSKQDDAAGAKTIAAAAKPDAAASAALSLEVEKLRSEKEKLHAEVVDLRKQVEELSLTPAVLLARVTEALATERPAEANQANDALEKRYPDSTQAKAAKAALAKYTTAVLAREAQAKALEARGFYALPVQNAPIVDGVTLRVESLQLGARWEFDAYDDRWHYRDAERGERFILLRTTLQSVDKSPTLPDVGVYLIDGKKMMRVAQISYEFRRWSSHGTFIGLYHDYKNDFAHTQAIPFTAAATINDGDAKKPFAVVVTGQSCHTRDSKIGQPEVVYRNYACNPKTELNVEDFVKGPYRVLAFFNRPKGT